MEFNLEKEIVLLMDRQVQKSRLIDPYKNKMKDHRRRFSRLLKISKMNRKEHYRSFRTKNKVFCKRNLKMNIQEIDGLVEPVFKKTSGMLTSQ